MKKPEDPPMSEVRRLTPMDEAELFNIQQRIAFGYTANAQKPTLYPRYVKRRVSVRLIMATDTCIPQSHKLRLTLIIRSLHTKHQQPSVRRQFRTGLLLSIIAIIKVDIQVTLSQFIIITVTGTLNKGTHSRVTGIPTCMLKTRC